MELRQLRYFVAVADQGSFSRAAEALGRTQQALSKGIQSLEESVGVRLLDRNPRQATPTVFGRLLLTHARNIDAEVRTFRTRLSEMLGADHGQVRLGASPTATNLLMADAVTQLYTKRPELRLNVIAGIFQLLLPALVRGELDLFVAVETVDDSAEAVVREVLCHDEYRIIAAANHPLAGRRGVDCRQLLEYPWLMGENLGDVGQAFEQSFESRGLAPPRTAIRTSSVEFLRVALMQGPYLCVLPSQLLAQDLREGKLTLLDAPDFCWRRPISLYYRQTATVSPAIVAVIDALHAAARQRDIAGGRLPGQPGGPA